MTMPPQGANVRGGRATSRRFLSLSEATKEESIVKEAFKRFQLAKVLLAMLIAILVSVMTVLAAPNFVKDSGIVSYLNGGADVVSGDVVDVGGRYGIAGTDIASNATGSIFVKGVWELTLATNQTVVLDAKLYWDSSLKQVKTTAVSGTYIGLAAEAVTTVAATALIDVDLNAAPRQFVGTVITGVTAQSSTNGVVTNIVTTTATVGY